MTKYSFFHLVMIFTFVIAGTFTIVTLKWCDLTLAESSDGVVRKFHHPFLQVSLMFLGSFYCYIIFYIMYYYFKWKGEGKEDTHFVTKGSRNFKGFMLAPAAILDMIANALNFLGLTMTYASSFQMFRGSIIIFIGIFSYIFLGRRLKVSEMMGMALSVCGLIVVGLTDYCLSATTKDISPLTVITGDLLVLLAQVFGAGFVVYEQKYCNKLDIPAMQAAGIEGIVGLIGSGLANFCLYFVYVGDRFGNHNPRGVLEDVVEAGYQIVNEPILILGIFVYTSATCIYKFSGITISKELSGLTRKVVDSFRIVLIWMIGILCFGQKFVWPTVNGFVILVFGLFLYSGCSVFGDTRKKSDDTRVPGIND